MELTDLKDYMISLIKEKIRHRDYDHVTKLADKYYIYFSGQGLDDELQQFTPREEKELFIQRKTITKHIVPSIAQNVASVEKKVPRSNGITKLIQYEGAKKDDKRISEIESVLKKFWGDASWDRYMEVRWIELNDTDPNTFVVFEWDDYDNVKEFLQPKPFEVSAHMAVDFGINNNILEYLTVLQNIKMIHKEKPEDESKDGEKYIVYLKNQTIVYTEIWEDNLMSSIRQDEIAIIGEYEYLRIEDRILRIEYPKEHNLDMVPAFRTGWNRDPATKGRTFISPWDRAMPYLEKIVKANSELDLTMALHTFPQKVVMVPKCDNPKCFDGYVTLPDGQKEKCPVCGGTGLMIHRSAQDIIAVPLPKTGEEQLSLENMIRYISTPIDLPKFQSEYIENMTQKCVQVVYNSDIFTRSEVAETATEKRIDLDNVYDALYPMAVRFSTLYKFGVHMVAKLIDRDKNLIVVHSFSKDFRFKSKDDYIAERKMAIDAQAPSEVLSNIDLEIMRIDTADNPDDFIKHQVMTDLDPFEGKSHDEITFIITSNNVPRQQIVLYSCYGFIYDDIIVKHSDFFEMPKNKQIDILYEYVDEYIKQIDATKTATELPEYK